MQCTQKKEKSGRKKIENKYVHNLEFPFDLSIACV